jgi:hypothetical protein
MVEFARCFLRLANLRNFALDRLSRYEATLWRQAGRTFLRLTYWIGENHKNKDDGLQDPSSPALIQTWRAILPGVVLSRMTLDRKQLAQLADREAVAIAMALPCQHRQHQFCWFFGS